MNEKTLEPTHRLLRLLLDADLRTRYGNEFIDMTGFQHVTLEWCAQHPLV